jgi:hypothetical protein
MSTMKERLIIPALIAFVLYTLIYPKGSYAQELPTKNFLKTFDWKSTAPINRYSKNWKIFTGDQSGKNGFKDRKILKEVISNIAELSYKGSIRRVHKTGRYDLVFFSGPGQDLEATSKNLRHCERLIKRISLAFGSPKNLVDLSDTDLSKDMARIKFYAFWNVNKSRVKLSCSALKVFKGYIPVTMIRYGHRDDIKKIFDPIFLKCSRKKKGIGSFANKKTTEEPPFTFLINPNNESLQSKKAKLGKTITFNDREIVTSFEVKKKNIKSIFVLDRYAGSYVWTIKIIKKRSGALAAGSGYKYWGDCTKILRGKKF